jgi:hypothetical protein
LTDLCDAEQPRDNGRQEVTLQDQRRDNSWRGNDGGRYAVPRVGPAPRYRDGDRRVYVQPRRTFWVYRYPSYRHYAPYSNSYYDPYYRGDVFWSFGTHG